MKQVGTDSEEATVCRNSADKKRHCPDHLLPLAMSDCEGLPTGELKTLLRMHVCSREIYEVHTCFSTVWICVSGLGVFLGSACFSQRTPPRQLTHQVFQLQSWFSLGPYMGTWRVFPQVSSEQCRMKLQSCLYQRYVETGAVGRGCVEV